LDGGDIGLYDESEFTGDGVVTTDTLSLACPEIAAGGSAKATCSERLPRLPGRISVEGAGVGSVCGDMLKLWWDMDMSVSKRDLTSIRRVQPREMRSEDCDRKSLDLKFAAAAAKTIAM
jgi:hypothetical protein